MFELCISGQALSIFLLSSLAHTINAFIGRFIWGLLSAFSFWALIIFAPNILPEKTEDSTLLIIYFTYTQVGQFIYMYMCSFG